MRYARLFIIILALSCAGCVPKMLKAKSAEANVLSGVYLKSLPVTTPEQDKAHIKAMDAEILQFDAALRGTEEASKTRALVK
jgi:hypothetical protein